MTEGLAIEIAAQKMCELGIGKDYLLRYRHFLVEPSGTRVIKGDNHLYILLTPETDARVNSKNGIYDARDIAINEMQYLHSGEITLFNQNPKVLVSIKFLQVIPIQKNT